MRSLSTLACAAALALLPLAALAQTGGVRIGTAGTPDASAVLDVSSTTKGLLLPRLSLAQRDALTANAATPPVPGLVIYQTDNTPGLYAYDGTAWVRLGADNLGSHTATQNLDLGPNQLVGNGGSTGLSVSNGGNVGIAGNASVNGGQGVLLNQQDRPLITRGWDAFASGSYQGAGRWGVFMEPSTLTFGVPALGGKSFQWVRYNDNSTVAGTLVTLTQEGNLGIGTPNPAASLDVNGGLVLEETASSSLTGANPAYTIPANVSTVRLVPGTTAPTGTIALTSTAPVVGQYLTVYNGTPIGATLGGQPIGAGQASLLVYSSGAWRGTSAAGDNLGNHTATQALNLQNNALQGTGDNLPANVVGIGITAKGGLNIGQYNSGTNTSLAQNIFIGYQAGQYNAFGTSPTLTGRNNHFIGYQAGNNNTSASNNQFDGYKAGYLNTTGHGNLAVGNSALYTNQQNSYNTAVGDSALFRATGNQPSTIVSANFNTALGFKAGVNTTTGSRNTFIGYQAGITNTGNNFGDTTPKGSSNIALGYQADFESSTLTNAIAIGAMARVGQSNSLALGGDGSTSRPAVNVGIGTSTPDYSLDVNGVARVGTSSTPGTVYTPNTGTHNLLAVAYGQIRGNTGDIVYAYPSGSSTPFFSTSGNYNSTAIRTGPGTYTIVFTSASGLSGYNFTAAVVAATLTGSGTSAPGFISWIGGTGVINISTYNLSGAATDRDFSFTVFQP